METAAVYGGSDAEGDWELGPQRHVLAIVAGERPDRTLPRRLAAQLARRDEAGVAGVLSAEELSGRPGQVRLAFQTLNGAGREGEEQEHSD